MSRGGLTAYSECSLTVDYNHAARASGRIEQRCRLHSSLGGRDLVAERTLSSGEVERLAKLVVSSDLYGGGHVGNYESGPQDAPRAHLEVFRCCGRSDAVVLVLSGNPTFSTGPRRELLDLFRAWGEPLTKEATGRG